MIIPKQAEREEALRLWQACMAADAAYDAASEQAAANNPEIIARYETLYAQLDDVDGGADYEEASAKLNAKRDAELGVEHLAKAAADADAACAAFAEDVYLVWTRGTLGPARCGKSGVPILHSDAIVEDVETNEVWLRSALGLPPRQMLDLRAEAVEEAA